MNYSLIKEVVELVEMFEEECAGEGLYTEDIHGFKHWMTAQFKDENNARMEPDWVGKAEGRSAESVISTLIVHLNRYAKMYSKSAMFNSDFSTQEEFIYLINLKVFGPMTKMELIKKNIQEKPAGIQIINRIVKSGWVKQTDSEIDKRSKVIEITAHGLTTLELQMQKIRKATQLVSGNLTNTEKLELIRLLNKLDHFHHVIYSKNIEIESLLKVVSNTYTAVDAQLL